MRVLLASPRGFCAGVSMATASLKRALEIYGPPVLVYHEIVHNNWIVQQFEKAGAVFINDINEAPPGSCVMFSAHGVSPQVRERARQLGLTTIDATCPLVRKVHDEAIKFLHRGFTVFLIGHAGHDEVVATLGLSDQIQLVQTEQDAENATASDPERTAYVMQTTLSVDDSKLIAQRLRVRFPSIVGPPKSDICYATQNRQQVVREYAKLADLVLVVGSSSSSNSTRLTEVARAHNCRAFLVDGPDELQVDWFDGVETVLLTAGASAPEILTQLCVTWMNDHFNTDVEEYSLQDEHAHFPLPVELRSPVNQPSSQSPSKPLELNPDLFA